jgi:molybdate transport system substrate-binding protein
MAAMRRLLPILLLGIGTVSGAAADIKVDAPVSLTDALRAIEIKFESITTDKLVLNLDDAKALARQISRGAPADVLLSADEAEMDRLQKAGLIDPATRHDILFNQLVVVVGARSPLPLATLADVAGAEVKRISMPDPREVAAGIYARAYLQDAKIWPEVAARILPSPDARAALAAVENGDADAGIIYATDAMLSQKVKVAFALPVSPMREIAYPAAALVHAPNPAGARKFVLYLEHNADARAVFARYGFIVEAPPHAR